MNKKRWGAGLTVSAVAAVAVFAWASNGADSSTDVRQKARVTRGVLSEAITATGVIRPVTGAEVNVNVTVQGALDALEADPKFHEFARQSYANRYPGVLRIEREHTAKPDGAADSGQ